MKKIDFIIRAAAPADALPTIRIGIKGWRYAYGKIISEGRLRENEARKMSPENIMRATEDIAGGVGIRLVATDANGKVLGFKFNQPDDDGEWRGGGTYIDPEYVGMGIGRALFVEFARRLRAMGKEKFWVSCMTDNKSMDFYRKLGGKVIKEYPYEKMENKSLSELKFEVKGFFDRHIMKK
ncbi:MAG: GNAT family N-acetyltransferase [Rickettsiales bacterium]|jgi:ribosomal protein S18 acetylase RimI-like enzyme|nr:GNAT family N-acetyltransferase [Rickettsiales bacterium]